METATAEREREIAALQADLGGVRSDLEHWRSTAAKYEAEIKHLQEAFMQQQQLQSSASRLQGERLHVPEEPGVKSVPVPVYTLLPEPYENVGALFRTRQPLVFNYVLLYYSSQ